MDLVKQSAVQMHKISDEIVSHLFLEKELFVKMDNPNLFHLNFRLQELRQYGHVYEICGMHLMMYRVSHLSVKMAQLGMVQSV